MLDVAIWNPRVGRPNAGGTETFLRNMARELQQRDDTAVTIYTDCSQTVPSELEDCDLRHVPTLAKEHRLNKVGTRITPLLDAEIESLSSFVRKPELEQHDVLSTHYYLDALLLSRAVDVPTVFRFPGIKHPSPRWRLFWKYADCETYISNSQTTSVRLNKWFDRELAGPVYAGVDTDRFQPKSVTDPNRILYVGRLGEGKGVGRLLKAARQLDSNYTVRIVGDGPLRNQLESDAPGCVAFVGTVNHDRIHREYQQAAVTVLPTVHEAFPVTVIESLACGTPVVATDIDATRLTIDHKNTGYLLSDRNPETICDGITQVLSHERYRTAARTDGRATAHNYDWASQADTFRSLLANVGDYPNDC